MARRIEVEILGDSRSLERAFARSEKSAQRFHGEVERAGRGALSAAVSFHGLGRAAGFASAQFLGAYGVVEGIKSTIDAAEESQRVMAQTRNAVERTGLSWDKYGQQIEETTLAQSKMSGFDDERLKSTFSLLVRRTGDVNKALKLNALAANVARGANIELEQAAKIVQRAAVGQARGLAVLGIQYDKTTTASQLLARLQQKYGSSAAAYANTAAGAQDRFKVAVENVQEALGAALLPTITKVANRSADWLNNTEKSKPAVDALTGSVDALATSLGKLATVAGVTFDVLHSLDRLKTKPLWNYLPKLEGPMGLTLFGGTRVGRTGDFSGGKITGPDFPVPGPAGTSGAGKAGMSARQMARLAEASAVQSNSWFDARIGRLLGRAGDPTSLRAQISRYRQISALLQQRLAATADITRRLKLEDQIADVALQIRGARQQIRGAQQQAAAKAAAKAAADAKARIDTQRGWLDFGVERAEATKRVSDDRAAYRKLEAWLQERIRHEGRTLELVKDLWETRQKIRDLNKKNTDPLAGLGRQVGTQQLTRMLAAGTGLDAAGRGRLAYNIAGADIVVHSHVILDGQQVAASVTRHQARAGRRTASQTSGLR